MDIRIVVPGLPIATPDPFAVSLGGSETAGLQLGRAFARKGHQVTVFCDVERPTRWQDVRLVPLRGYETTAAARAGDLLLIQRDPTLLALPHAAKSAFLWVHDQLSPAAAHSFAAAMPAVDRLVTVSAWQAQQFRGLAPGLGAEQVLVTRNGIDLELIAAAVRRVGERDPYRIVYSARPERGLEVMFKDVFPRILAEEPRATLHLATYDCPALAVEPYYRHLRKIADGFGDRVVQHGALAKRDLYRLMATAGLYLYPTPAPAYRDFAETSCITAMEAMACGLPWISTDTGALPETVGDAGLLVSLNGAAHAAEGAIPQRLAAAALQVIRDREHAERLRAAGLARAAGLGWGGVADQLEAAVVEIAATQRPSVRSQAVASRPSPVVAIATPVYRGVDPGFVNALLATTELLPRRGVGVQWLYEAGNAVISSARSILAASCLADPSVTHILWIDGDIEWEASDVLRLLQFDVDFAVGLYPHRATPPASDPLWEGFVFNPLVNTKAGGSAVDPHTGLLEIESAGTGFMLTRRVVYERMAAAYPESKLTDGRGLRQAPQAALSFAYNHFPIMVENGSLVGEDIAFCRRWRRLGGKIWADPGIQLTHNGACAYRRDPMSMFRVTPAATDPTLMAGAA